VGEILKGQQFRSGHRPLHVRDRVRRDGRRQHGLQDGAGIRQASGTEHSSVRESQHSGAETSQSGETLAR